MDPSITLAKAQAAANDLAAQLASNNPLTPAERSNLVYDLKDAARRLDQIEQQLAAHACDDLADAIADAAPDPAAPSNELQFGQRLPDIGAWAGDMYERPAAWRAIGEPREDQQ